MVSVSLHNYLSSLHSAVCNIKQPTEKLTDSHNVLISHKY